MTARSHDAWDAENAFVKQVAEVGIDHICEAKLLIIGEPGVGKTSLAKKIANPRYMLVNSEKTTKGIDVIPWSFTMEDGKPFRVNIWDFGGQEIYYATHQFFLTRRSLYVLVADSRKEDTDFYYWLNAVELLSGSSPLIVKKRYRKGVVWSKRVYNNASSYRLLTNGMEVLASVRI